MYSIIYKFIFLKTFLFYLRHFYLNNLIKLTNYYLFVLGGDETNERQR